MDSLLGELTDVELVWKDPISEMDMYQRAGFGATICFNNLYGFLLIPPMMSYEKYGRDPQKRGLKSQVSEQIICFVYIVAFAIHMLFQLYYQVSANILIGNLVSQPILFWRYVVGPLNSPFCFLLILFINSYQNQCFIAMLEAHSLKFLSVVILGRLPAIIDDFIARFLALSNLAIGLYLALVNWFTTFAIAHKLIFSCLPAFLLYIHGIQLNFK